MDKKKKIEKIEKAKDMNKLGQIASFRRLDKGEHEKTRPLWEAVFDDDSEAFLDYYYAQCAEKNEIYAADVDNQDLVSMVQLNPYQVHLDDSLVDVHYVVGVATKAEYRHRGLMRGLLNLALKESYKKGEPFLFLMPASEAIYTPFDFRTVYYQNQMRLSLEESEAEVHAAEYHNIEACPAKAEDAGELAEFSESILSESYQVYVKRTKAYFEKMMLEQASENGCVLMFKQDGCIIGYCFTAGEDSPEVWEMVTREDYEEPVFDTLFDYLRKWMPEAESVKISAFPEMFEDEDTLMVPLIMTRIVNLISLAACLRAVSPVNFVLSVKDEIISENEGIYRFTIDKEHGSAKKIEAPDAGEKVVQITAAELSEVFFGGKSKQGIPCGKLVPLKNIFLNEIV